MQPLPLLEAAGQHPPVACPRECLHFCIARVAREARASGAMAAQARDVRSNGAPAVSVVRSSGAQTTTAAMIAQAKASCSSAPPAAPARDVMDITSDDGLPVCDPFMMAFGAPPPQEESTVPWRGP